MITIRHAEERGAVNLGWLEGKHSFSFGDYYDVEHMGFNTLRVINEDRIAPSKGFGTHGHKDMEIVTYMIAGALEHKDNMGNGSVIRAGEVQRMSAGTGVMHSEFNRSAKEQAHLLQIWVLPEETGISPGYEQKAFAAADKTNRLCLIASRDARDGSLKIHQALDLYASNLDRGEVLAHELRVKRSSWIQVVSGIMSVNGELLHSGDGVAIDDTRTLEIEAIEDTEFLLFDMA